MSLEEALAANTAALKELTAAVIAGNEGRAAVLEKAQAIANKDAAPKPARKSEPEKPVTKTEESKVEVPTESEGPTVEDVNEAIKSYVGPATRPEEREARKAKVVGVLKKFSPEGTEKPNGATLAADKRAAFIKTVAKWLEEGDLTTPADESPDDDLLDD